MQRLLVAALLVLAVVAFDVEESGKFGDFLKKAGEKIAPHVKDVAREVAPVLKEAVANKIKSEITKRIKLEEELDESVIYPPRYYNDRMERDRYIQEQRDRYMNPWNKTRPHFPYMTTKYPNYNTDVMRPRNRSIAPRVFFYEEEPNQQTSIREQEPVRPRPGKPGKPVKPGKPGFGGKPERPGRPGFGGKPERPGRPGFGGKPERPGRPGFGGKPERPGRPEKPGKPGFGGKPGIRPIRPTPPRPVAPISRPELDLFEVEESQMYNPRVRFNSTWLRNRTRDQRNPKGDKKSNKHNENGGWGRFLPQWLRPRRNQTREGKPMKPLKPRWDTNKRSNKTANRTKLW